MGRDNHPKERQRKELERKKQGQRAQCERILIVSEGSKTEPLYFDEIRVSLRLPVRNVATVASALGTESNQVVESAKALFLNGDPHKGIGPRAFDQVYAVFDRDDHATYSDALRLAESLDGKLKNDVKQSVRFRAITSVPSFELWLLLHYEDIQAPLHRDEALRRLKQYIQGYEKGAGQTYAISRDHIPIAIQRAEELSARFSAHTAPQPYTAVFDLVRLLTSLHR